jgi:hypothetical protein
MEVSDAQEARAGWIDSSTHLPDISEVSLAPVHWKLLHLSLHHDHPRIRPQYHCSTRQLHHEPHLPRNSLPFLPAVFLLSA